MTAILFVLAQFLIVFLGGVALRSSHVRSFTILGRVAFCFLAGAVFLTVEATVFSMMRIRWSVFSLAVPLLLLSAVGLFPRRGRKTESKRSDRKPVAPLLPVAIVLISVAHLVAGIVTTRSASIDFVLFWGVKAIRFAEARAIDAIFLITPFSAHTHINYPPLVPISMAWSAIAAGNFPWLWATLTSVVWFIATLPVLYSILRIRMTRENAALVTAFWSAAMSLSLTASMNGGNAEIPLLAYETLACALILIAPAATAPIAILLAGAALTKQEGLVAVLLLVAGAMLREWIMSRQIQIRKWLVMLVVPLFAIGTWWAFSLKNGIPLSDPIRERVLNISFAHTGTIAAASLQYLHAGSWWLSWLLAIVALFVARHAWRDVFPAIFFAISLLAFTLVFYLHVEANHERLIEWTLPRLSQPALSALIVAAGVAWFGQTRDLLNENSGVADDRAVVAVDVA